MPIRPAVRRGAVVRCRGLARRGAAVGRSGARLLGRIVRIGDVVSTREAPPCPRRSMSPLQYNRPTYLGEIAHSAYVAAGCGAVKTGGVRLPRLGEAGRGVRSEMFPIQRGRGFPGVRIFLPRRGWALFNLECRRISAQLAIRPTCQRLLPSPIKRGIARTRRGNSGRPSVDTDETH